MFDLGEIAFFENITVASNTAASSRHSLPALSISFPSHTLTFRQLPLHSHLESSSKLASTWAPLKRLTSLCAGLCRLCPDFSILGLVTQNKRAAAFPFPFHTPSKPDGGTSGLGPTDIPSTPSSSSAHTPLDPRSSSRPLRATFFHRCFSSWIRADYSDPLNYLLLVHSSLFFQLSPHNFRAGRNDQPPQPIVLYGDSYGQCSLRFTPLEQRVTPCALPVP